ncbi:hypothetical protein MUGA111182_03300 [Mucilaginibacter galii]|uniref:Lipoprotein n=2 Tax=Mucilaginibacter galii TaxID=2005073 RepID=A0A917J8F3_9SPHI|nr:hypothetical protein GCM10011425_16280 [Mucilaginibacter galii]
MKMKKLNIILASLFCASLLGSCKIGGLEFQKDFKYKPGQPTDAHINKSALQYLRDRGKTPVVANDTVFKYMQLGLEYAGLDPAEYEKAGRTFIFLSNNAVRVLPTTSSTVNGQTVVRTTSNIPTAGFWFEFQILDKNPDGSQKYAADGITPITHPATSWNEYSPQTVKNYFLSLIGQGDLGFSTLNNANQSLTSILPVGTVAGKESKLGFFVSSPTPNYNISGNRTIAYDYVNNTGKGFDPESKFNLKVTNADFSPMVFNDNANVATGGLLATNGQIHVVAVTAFPSRY